MKKIGLFALLTTLFLAVGAQDFSSVCSTGQTLYYSITSSVSPYTVAVTRPPEGFYQISGALDIPASVTHEGTTYSVTKIEEGAFFNCSQITQINFPNTIDSILFRGFYGCASLTSLSFPSSLRYIDNQAFAQCEGLTDTLFIPDNVNYLGSNAFFQCTGINAVVLSNSLTTIEPETFSGCRSINTHLVIPEGVQTIGTGAFYLCHQMTGLTLPQSLQRIGRSAFEGCISITGTIIFGDSLVSIEEYAFFRCRNLSGIIFGNSLNTITNSSFGACNRLTRIVLPSNLTEVEPYSFTQCEHITWITFPRTLRHLGNSAFSGCTDLTGITCYASIPPALDSNVFDQVDSSIQIYVPCERTQDYMSSNSEWAEFFNYNEIMNTVVIVQSINEDMGTVDITEYPSCDNARTTFYAIPNEGYKFSHWNDGDTNISRTVAVGEDDVTYTAYFEALPNPIGIDNINVSEPIINAQHGSITVRDNKPIYIEIYDINGRQLHHTFSSAASFNVPNSGIYLVMINHKNTHKICVLK